MCGGIRQFESMRAQATQFASLVHDEDTTTQLHLHGSSCANDPYNPPGGDYDLSAGVCSSSGLLCKPLLSPPQDIKQKIAHLRGLCPSSLNSASAAAAPTGLAILAAFNSQPAHQSPALTSCPWSAAAPPLNVVNQNRRCVKQGLSPAPPTVAPNCSRTTTGNLSVEHSQSNAGQSIREQSATTSAVCAELETKSKRKSIFDCCVLSPSATDTLDSSNHAQQQQRQQHFMDACFCCKRPLGSGNDVFIYRGDRAFCSNECRYQHIVKDELIERFKQKGLQGSAAATANPDRCSKDGLNAITSLFVPVLG